MILAFFNKNHFTHTLGLLLYASVLRLAHVLNTRDFSIDSSYRVWDSLWDGSAQGILAQLAAILLSFIIAVMLNRLSIQHRLSNKISLHAGLVYLLLLAWTPAGWSLHMVLLVSVIILLLLEQVFRSYKLQAPRGEAFNVGFAASTAVVIFPSIYLLWAFCFVAMMIIRNFKWREVLQLIIGILTPIILVTAIAHYFDMLVDVKEHLLHILGWLDFQPWLGGRNDWIFFAPPGSMILLAVVLYTFNVSKKNNQAIKKIDILYWLLICLGASALIGYQIDGGLIALALLPTSILISFYLTKLTGKFWIELFHVLLLGLTIFSQFYIYQ